MKTTNVYRNGLIKYIGSITYWCGIFVRPIIFSLKILYYRIKHIVNVRDTYLKFACYQNEASVF